MPLLDDIVECPRVFVSAFGIWEECILTIFILSCPIMLNLLPSCFPKGFIRIRDKSDIRKRYIRGVLLLIVCLVNFSDRILEQKDIFGSNDSTISRPTRFFAVLLVIVNKIIATITSIGANDVFFQRRQDKIFKCSRQSKEQNGTRRKRFFFSQLVRFGSRFQSRC